MKLSWRKFWKISRLKKFRNNFFELILCLTRAWFYHIPKSDLNLLFCLHSQASKSSLITEIKKCDYKINDKRRESNFPREALSGRAGNTLILQSRLSPPISSINDLYMNKCTVVESWDISIIQALFENSRRFIKIEVNLKTRREKFFLPYCHHW